MSNIKKVFSLGLAVLALVVVFGSVNKVYANTCTFVGDGDWHTTGNWSGCGGVLPQSTDSVVIPTGSLVTMSGSSTITALTFNDAVADANSLTVGSGNTLTVSGATTYTATTGVSGSTLAVGAGTFTTGTLVINDGAAAGDMVLSVSTGTINVTGNISGTWTNAADVQFTSTGDSDMNFGGNFPSGATLDDTGGRITFNGTGAQDVGAYTTYNNVTINKTAGTATLLGTTTFGGTLTLTDGNLDTNTQTFTVAGASSITDTITFGTGTKTFTGDVTLNSGAVWNETGAAVVVFAGNLTNNATTFTASTGLHTMSGATKVMSGSTTTVIPSLRITGATSNTGTLTVATLLDVADATTFTNTGTVTATTALSDVGTTGVFVNGASGTLNIGDVIDIGTLTATAAGNTVNYTKAGAQTVFGTTPTYVNLGVSGSGIKTIPATTTIGGNLTIGGTATVTLTGSASTANKLYFGTSLQRSGTWGATAATAAHETDTYFTTGVATLITVANGSSGSGGGSNTVNQTVYTYTAGGGSSVSTSSATTPASTSTTPATPATPASAVSCPPGHMYSTENGKKCTEWTSDTTPSPQGKAYAFGTILVKQGSKGGACLAWQQFLNDKANAGLATDGACGKLTMAAARAWQAKMGLTADGLLGPMSRAKAMMQ